ncbi:MAG TPA: SUMF1/EgtB/PvdO family nonheme iron enzyme [Bacteroidia bacterium]|nr:SUMF1/EgtB/PvdO family nonheme iron enzyme [Bacteroidia bacterium]
MRTDSPQQSGMNGLDSLLRQFVLEGGDDPFTQKTLDMNAEFVFSQTAAAPSDARGAALVEKLAEAFPRKGNSGRFRLSGAIFILLISVASWMYFSSSPQVPSATGSSPGNKSSSPLPPAPSGDTSSVTEITVKNHALAARDSSGIASANDSVSGSDTAHVSKDPSHHHYANDNRKIDLDEKWYEGKYPVNVPGPAFSAKASPENFHVMSGSRAIDSLDNAGAFSAGRKTTFRSVYYSGIPFKSGLNDMQYLNFGESVFKDSLSRFYWNFPWTMIGQLDSDAVTVATKKNKDGVASAGLFASRLPEKGIRLVMEPFYFRKYEVTNKEYREFLEWVRASNGYAGKPLRTFTADTVPVTDTSTLSGYDIKIKGKTYRVHITSFILLEDYHEVYNYVFFNDSSEAVRSLGKNSLYVYPDTLCWTTDFTFSYNEPMANMYFWHPAYDNYPVVGVSWYQALAFLDWKTHFHQQSLDAAGVPYKIEYTLPSDVEWDLVSTALPLKDKAVPLAARECCNDWITDLALSYSGHDDPYQRFNYLKRLLTKDENFNGDYIADGYFFTGPADLTQSSDSYKEYKLMGRFPRTDNADLGNEKDLDRNLDTRHYDILGISWMDGNVSEWMMESYAENWEPFFKKHLLVMDADTSEAAQLAEQIEMLYDKGNAKNGRLVRGANWYDERFAGKPGSGVNEAGISAKRFIDPQEQHCTVGFRYVLHVKYKDEKARLSKN